MLKIYKIPSDKVQEVKKILENPDVKENNWARNGYTLRDAKILGFEENVSYLYVKGLDEFFEQNEKQITEIENIIIIEGEEFEKVKTKIDEESDSTASGIGAIFG